MPRWKSLGLAGGALLVTALVIGGEEKSEARSVASAHFAPTLLSPAAGEVLTAFGATLTWANPDGATQVHLRVVPASDDGPGVDVHLGSPAASFSVSPPPGWYGLLPDMTYTWRVRVSDASDFVGLDDPTWGPWAEARFRAPSVSSATISPVSPAQSAVVTTLNPILQWANSRSEVFYYEVQISNDVDFGAGLFGAWAPVYWELVHGGLTDPLDSYLVPEDSPLRDNMPYYWRVRPRVQGDGTPVGWSSIYRFDTVTAAGRSAPAPTPVPGAALGGKIAFSSDLSFYWDIFVMNPDGTGRTRVTSSFFTDLHPTWSPDGARIAFTSDRDGNAEIYAINTDGSDATRLTDNEATDWIPSWSPDGAKIAFTSDREGSSDIYVMNADGSGVIRLTDDPSGDEVPAWSPNGTKIAFRSDRDGDYEIYVMNADGTGQTRLTDNRDGDYDPAFSPDGRFIVFSSIRDGNEEIYVMSAEGASQTRLTRDPALDEQPDWSPDGTKVVFTSNRDGNQDIYVMNADGSGVARITRGLADDRGPDWSAQ